MFAMRIDISKPKDLSKRTKSGFLFFPRIVNDQLRWLCWATWIEIYHVAQYSGLDEWIASEWID